MTPEEAAEEVTRWLQLQGEAEQVRFLLLLRDWYYPRLPDYELTIQCWQKQTQVKEIAKP